MLQFRLRLLMKKVSQQVGSKTPLLAMNSVENSGAESELYNRFRLGEVIACDVVNGSFVRPADLNA